MKLRRTSLSALMLALSAGVWLTAGSAGAQQASPGLVNPNATTNSALKDAPQTPAAQKLAPVASPPIAAAADKLPLAQLHAPKDFKIEVYASGLTNARSLRIGDKGTVFVGSRLTDKVYAITSKDGKRAVKTLLTGLYRPNGIALHDGTLYIAELSQISKVDDVENHLDDAPKPQVIYSDLPKDEPHGWKFLAVGPDNRLYFNIGAPCNICMPPETNAQLRSINLDGSDPQVIARGIRQVVGMDWNPQSKKLYFTENQRDWLSEDIPQDKLNRLDHPGQDNFGFPYCHEGDILDPEFGWGHSCDEFTKPIALLGPHSAPLGMRFYTGHMFPAEYRNQIFIARHGSWNRTHKIGGDIVVATLDKNGNVKSVKPFITGFIQDNKYVGRPADLEVMKDGSLLISDDYNGAVYRVTYAGAQHQLSETR
ncbi:MAG TPA: PQQ-dependent sugar dehydrogenase [Stellaceae bacterium]|nr:PQQ-dependent sugar dehydrogenase [Stellaceae bacterium]